VASFKRDVVITAVTQSLIFVATFCISVLTARALGPGARGIFSFLMMVVVLLVIIESLSLGASMVYHAGRSTVSRNEICGFVIAASTFLAAVVFATLYFGWPHLESIFPIIQDRRELRVIFAAVVASSLCATLFNQYFRAATRIKAFNVTRLMLPVCRLLALSVIYPFEVSVESSGFAFFAANMVVVAFQLLAMIRDAAPAFANALGWTTKIVAYGLRIHVPTLMTVAQFRVTGFFVAAHVSAETFAFFAIADGLAKTLQTLPAGITAVLLPRISRQGDAQAADLTARTNRCTLFIVALVVVVIAVFVRDFIDLAFGSAYVPAATFTIPLVLATMFRSSGGVLTGWLIVTKRTNFITAVNAAALVMHIGLLFIVTPRYGAWGACWVVLFTAVCRASAFFTLVRRNSGIGWSDLLIVTRSDLADMAAYLKGSVLKRSLR
jgi:O-antigen/teichoic acid export membrane protein